MSKKSAIKTSVFAAEKRKQKIDHNGYVLAFSLIASFCAQAQEPTPQPIGQAPEDDLSRLFLRDTEVLLKPQQFQFSLGFDYNSNEALRSFRQNRERSFVIPLGISYGVSNRLEINATLPLQYKSYEVINPTEVNKDNQTGVGDLSLGVSYTLKTETASFPAVTSSFGLTAPTGKQQTDSLSIGSGHWAASSRLNVSKSIDPAVVFANVGYQYTHGDEKNGVTVKPGGSLTYGVGAGFSINDAVSFSGRISGNYQAETQRNGQKISGSSAESITLGTGIAYRINRNARLETNVSFGLTEDAGDVGMGATYLWDVR